MGKYLTMPIIYAFGTMIILYIIGFLANRDILIFKVTSSSTEVAILPIVAGLLVGVIIERVIKLKSQQ